MIIHDFTKGKLVKAGRVLELTQGKMAKKSLSSMGVYVCVHSCRILLGKINKDVYKENAVSDQSLITV